MSKVERVYPHLDPDVERRLEAIKQLAEKDAGYFLDSECPYPWLRPFMMRGTGGGTGAGGGNEGNFGRVSLFGEEGKDDEDVLLREVEIAIEEMKSVQLELKSLDVEPTDMAAFYKSYTVMFEKWVGLRERLVNMKHLRDFQRVVVGFMDEILEKDQQQEFKNRLKGMMI